MVASCAFGTPIASYLGHPRVFPVLPVKTHQVLPQCGGYSSAGTPCGGAAARISATFADNTWKSTGFSKNATAGSQVGSRSLLLNPRGNCWLTAVKQEHGQVAERAADGAGQLEARRVVFGKHHVEDHRVRAALLDATDCLLGIGFQRRSHVPGLRRTVPTAPAKSRIVIHDQQACHVMSSFSGYWAMVGISARCRTRENRGKTGALSRGAFDANADLAGHGRLSHDGQPQAGRGLVVLGGFVGAEIVVEDPRQFVGGDADARVADDHRRPARPVGAARDRDLASARESS